MDARGNKVIARFSCAVGRAIVCTGVLYGCALCALLLWAPLTFMHRRGGEYAHQWRNTDQKA